MNKKLFWGTLAIAIIAGAIYFQLINVRPSLLHESKGTFADRLHRFAGTTSNP